MHAGTFTTDRVSADNAQGSTEKLCNCIARRQPALMVGQSLHDMHDPDLTGFVFQELPDQANDQTTGQRQQQSESVRETLVILDVTFRQQQALRGFHQHPEGNDDTTRQQAHRDGQHGQLWQGIEAGNAQSEIVQPLIPAVLEHGLSWYSFKVAA